MRPYGWVGADGIRPVSLILAHPLDFGFTFIKGSLVAEPKAQWLKVKARLVMAGVFLAAFFDRYLKKIDAGLLNGPSPLYPEVQLH